MDKVILNFKTVKSALVAKRFVKFLSRSQKTTYTNVPFFAL